MSQDELIAAGCVGKHPYPSRLTAAKVAKRYNTTPYRCPYCHAWHLGSDDTPGGKPRWMKKRKRD